MVSEEVSFHIDDLVIAGQEWGVPGNLPIIALHGWLDNSASFDRIAPLLKNIHLIALDSAGHGKSSHRAKGGPYLIWQDVADVFEVADQMGWQSFGLLGHSRGAIISTLAAGTFPERISHLGLIDGFRPGSVSAEESPQQLARSIIETKRNRHRGFAHYPDEETAIMVRQRSEIPLNHDAAKMLTGRGLKEVDGGFTWSSDPQLKIASGFKLSEEHCDAFIQRISARIKLIIAENGIPRIKEGLEKVVKKYPQVEVERMAGSHHLHMEDPAEKVADVFNQFFL
ncbi:MAG: alpha/beta hydrolase [Cellvibrionaceae bacterium]